MILFSSKSRKNRTSNKINPIMAITVDVHLRESSLGLLRAYFSALEDVNGELQATFLGLLKTVIRRRVLSLTGSVTTISSEDCFREGKGSIKIDDPPTKAQERIIFSLVKVILHEESQEKNNKTINTVHDNMLFSVFVKVAYISRYQDNLTPWLLENSVSVEDSVKNIFENGGKKESKKQTETDETVEIYLYVIDQKHYLEDSFFAFDAHMLSSEFDKIELSDSNSDYFDDITAANTNNDQSHNKSFSLNMISKNTKSLAIITALPNSQLEGTWESLYYSSDIKTRMMNYSTASLKVATMLGKSRRLEYNELLNSNNKMLLIHGPPGTGKTTLCKALCHKLSIRLCNNTELVSEKPNSIMVELSCSRIFSRWFGESTKNLSSIFTDIEQLLASSQDLNNFVFLLIDEVETIASSRRDLSNKNETTDAIRVVNSLLTHLDKMKKYKNFLALATSNLLDILDNAFVDRADGIFYIGIPQRLELKMMLSSVLKSMMDVDIISSADNRDTREYDRALDLIAIQCEVCIKN